MSRSLLVVGCNHSVAAIELRERLAITKSALPLVLARFRDVGIDEVYALSTCNRTDVYVVGADPGLVVDLLSERQSVEPAELDAVLYRRWDEDAVRHLFAVASGLDSMVVGEVEILGQIRSALAAAREAGTLGKTLDRLVCSALATGKRVRTQTDISTGATSISNAAVELARAEFGPLDTATVLVLGAGEIAESTARVFASRGTNRLLFANRTLARSERLACRYGGAAVSYLEAYRWLRDADIVVSATDAPHVVLRAEQVRAAMAERGDRPLYVIDLAVPRDVEPAVVDVPRVSLCNVDQLQRIVEQNLNGRRASAVVAQAIVDEEAAKFMTWVRSLDAVSMICSYRQQSETIRRAVLSELSGELKDLTPGELATIDRLTRRLTNRLIHRPTVGLRAAAGQSAEALERVSGMLLGRNGTRAKP